MFQKILIANRGEIAVRVIQTCRDIGIPTLALYDPSDRESLHVRLADECVMLESSDSFMDYEAILGIAREYGADAIHPGYGFLAEEQAFILACEEARIKFIGPPASVVNAMCGKIEVLAVARAAGIPTVENSPVSFSADEFDALREAAESMGYPLIVKSCRGGRGPGERLILSSDRLEDAVRRAQGEAQAVFGDPQVYLEKAIVPAHQVGVQVVGDSHGNLIHLGAREGSLIYGNRKAIEETPAPCLNADQRERLLETALELAGLFDYQNVGTVEFLVDAKGQFFFTEIKARIQTEHPLTETVARIDLVREQIRIAAGEPLSLTQDQVDLQGWSMSCRISAVDPERRFLPSPGRLDNVRLPGGPGVRVDTYVYSGCTIPAEYNPVIAKLTVWGEDRQMCVARMRRALEDFVITGTQTNLPWLQSVLNSPDFLEGGYTTDFLSHPFEYVDVPEVHLRDLAAITAVLYARRNQMFNPTVPERLLSGWHRSSRRLPE